MGISPTRSSGGRASDGADHNDPPVDGRNGTDKPGFNADGSPLPVDTPLTDAEVHEAVMQGVQSFCTRFYQSNKEQMGAAMKPVVDKAPDDDD